MTGVVGHGLGNGHRLIRLGEDMTVQQAIPQHPAEMTMAYRVHSRDGSGFEPEARSRGSDQVGVAGEAAAPDVLVRSNLSSCRAPTLVLQGAEQAQ